MNVNMGRERKRLSKSNRIGASESEAYETEIAASDWWRAARTGGGEGGLVLVNICSRVETRDRHPPLPPTPLNHSRVY